jgi:hypothetical protein
MIEWSEIKDRHVKGICPRGKLWIRLDREGQVLGLYTLFGTTVKYVPETEEELGLEAMQIRAELILELHDFADQLALNNKR